MRRRGGAHSTGHPAAGVRAEPYVRVRRAGIEAAARGWRRALFAAYSRAAMRTGQPPYECLRRRGGAHSTGRPAVRRVAVSAPAACKYLL